MCIVCTSYYILSTTIITLTISVNEHFSMNIAKVVLTTPMLLWHQCPQQKNKHLHMTSIN